MTSCQFFHDCNFAPVNCQKKEKEGKNPSPIINYIIFQFSVLFALPIFIFPLLVLVSRSPLPVPYFSNTPLHCKQERMSCGKRDYKGCFIRLELLIIEKKKNKTTKKERNSRLMHHCFNWRLTHYFRILFLSTTFKAHKSHSPSIDWPALDLIFIRRCLSRQGDGLLV